MAWGDVQEKESRDKKITKWDFDAGNEGNLANNLMEAAENDELGDQFNLAHLDLSRTC